MALTGKLDVELQIQSSADKFYNFFKTQMYHLPSVSADIIQNVQLHEGQEWDSEDAVKLWNYTVDGKALTAKEKVSMDDENRVLTFTVIEGDVLEEFKSFKSTGRATPKADGQGSVVTWSIIFEKLRDDVADPKGYVNAIVKITKDADAHLLSASS